MKKILLLAVFCGMAITVMAQDSEKTKAAYDLMVEGVKLFDNGDYVKAMDKYNAALKLDDTYAAVYYEKASTLLALDNKKEAKKTLVKSFKKCAKVDLALNYKLFGDILDIEDNAREAIDYYYKALNAQDDMSPKVQQNLLYNIGVTYDHLATLEPDSCNDFSYYACNCFEESLKLNPQHPGSYYAFTKVILNETRRDFGFSWAVGMIGWYGFFGANHSQIGMLEEIPDKWGTLELTQQEIDSLGPRTLIAYESLCESAKKKPSEYGKLYDMFMYVIPKVADGYTSEPVPLQLAEDMHNQFLWPLYAKMVREGVLETFCHVVAMRDSKHYITNANWVTKNDEAVKKLTDMLNNGRYFNSNLIEEKEYGRVPPMDSVSTAEDAHAHNEDAIMACRYYLNHYLGSKEMQKCSQFILSWSQASSDVSIALGDGEAKWLNEETSPYLVAYMAACALYMLDNNLNEMNEEAYCHAVSTVVWYYSLNKDKTGTNDELERMFNLHNTDEEAFKKEVQSNFPGNTKK